MPGLVTPARRRRGDDGSDGDDDEDVSRGGEDSEHSTNTKRARLDVERDDDEDSHRGSESPEPPLLPDTFRRSPKGKGPAIHRVANGHQANGDGTHRHQPGSIVRVKLTDFVTYSKAEFHPGPNLNMIIGPNGTGKSTLVCAICLGLGWGTTHLGRAKDISEFVKHGASKAEIEIELAADPDRHEENPVITHKITKAGSKSDFYIDGKKEAKKRVIELARSFSIQVDNLCQFLPQDRVVEFAALSPVDLLAQTQKAAAPEYMTEWHEQLKVLRKDQKTKQADQQRDIEYVKNLEERQRLAEPDVARLRERSDLQERQAALLKFRPFPQYKVAKQKFEACKRRKENALEDFKRLQDQIEPNLRAVVEKADYLSRVERAVATRKRFVERAETNAADQLKKQAVVEDALKDCAKDIGIERKSVKDKRVEIDRQQKAIINFRKAMETAPPEFDPAAINVQIREKTMASRTLDEQVDEIRTSIGSLAQQGKHKQQQVQNLTKEKQDLQSQAGQQANRLRQANSHAYRAWEWVQNNRSSFKTEVFGPPMMECSLKAQQHAAAFESMIPAAEMTSLTVTSQEDFKMLQEQLYGTLKLTDISIRSSLQPLTAFRPPCSTEELRAMGLESWLLDLVEGPEPVLAMLCDNRNIHQTGFTSHDISTEQFNVLQRSSISSWVTPFQSYQISRRREYGEKAVSTRVQPIRGARFFTDTPVALGQNPELDRRIDELTGEIAEMQQQVRNAKERGNELSDQRRQNENEIQALKEDKAQKQRQMTEFQALPTKLEKAERQRKDAQDAVDASRERQLAIVERGEKLTIDKGQLSLDYANAVDVLRGLHVQLYEAEILAIEAKSDHEQLEARHAEETALLKEREEEVQALDRESKEALKEGKRLQAVCQEVGQHLSDFEQRIHDEIQHWHPDVMETEIESVQARLDMDTGMDNRNILREYEERKKKVEHKRAKLAEVEQALEELDNQIIKIREQWEPQLDQLIAQISAAFAENFTQIQCAGEVAVHKDEEFDLWAIQIRVKFREHEQLSVLDSHRQSGGERAVSTIFYLMALQSLARAPFRVVDEINQGMDPRNERLVHSRMVDIACSEDGRSGSQYFLITPKLLNGLKYHPSMKVHCIASGEFMPADHRELDFGMLAQRAYAVRQASSVRAAG